MTNGPKVVTSTVEFLSTQQLHQRLLTLFAEGWVLDQQAACEVRDITRCEDAPRMALDIDAALGITKLTTRQPVEAKALFAMNQKGVLAVAVCRPSTHPATNQHCAGVQVGELVCLELSWASARPLTWGYRQADLARAAISRGFANGENRFLSAIEELASRAMFRGQVWQLAGLLHEAGYESERAQNLMDDVLAKMPLDLRDEQASEHRNPWTSQLEDFVATLVRKTMETSIRKAWETDDIPF